MSSKPEDTNKQPDNQPAPIPVEYGNREGRYFTQWRIDLLEELLERIVYNYDSTPLITVESPKVWYDAEQDFHRLEFRSGGKHFHVQFYKVFTAFVDGEDGWRGCPRSSMGRFAKYLRDLARGIKPE